MWDGMKTDAPQHRLDDEYKPFYKCLFKGLRDQIPAGMSSSRRERGDPEGWESWGRGCRAAPQRVL